MHDDNQSLANFNGMVRLFPLPNVVLFPHVIQPFHIFEPRYRQMTADALAGDRLLAPVLLRPGWEANYEGRPAIHQVLCIGRIVAEQRLPDGRYNLLLRGLSRARIVSELATAKPYRSARVELQPDGCSPPEPRVRQLRQEISQAVQAWFPQQGPILEQLEKVLQSDLSLGVLCDLLSFAVPLAVELKQQLLEEVAVEARAQLLLNLLQSTPPPELLPPPQEAGVSTRKFPPEFSKN